MVATSVGPIYAHVDIPGTSLVLISPILQKLDQTCHGNLLSFQIEYQTGINTYQFYTYMYGINSCNFNFWYQEVVNTSLICWNSYDTYGPDWENSMKQICFEVNMRQQLGYLMNHIESKFETQKILSTTPPTLFCIKYAHSLNRYCAETTPKKSYLHNKYQY